jgi:hypothetical protein
VGEFSQPGQGDGFGSPGHLEPTSDAGRVAAEIERADPGVVAGIRPPVFRSNPFESVRVIERVGGVDRGCS